MLPETSCMLGFHLSWGTSFPLDLLKENNYFKCLASIFLDIFYAKPDATFT